MATLYTFKCDHHSELDYKEWAIKFYGENKCIVSPIEHGQQNKPHVHFIGYSNLSAGEFNKIKKDLSDNHPKRVEKTAEGHPAYPKGIQPVRQALGPVTELGFQYVLKLSAHPMFSQGFTQAELDEYKVKSDDHVKQLKSGAKDHCHARSYTGAPEEVHVKIHSDTIDFHKANGSSLRPQIAMDTINIMLSHPNATDDWVRYIKRKTILK